MHVVSTRDIHHPSRVFVIDFLCDFGTARARCHILLTVHSLCFAAQRTLWHGTLTERIPASGRNHKAAFAREVARCGESVTKISVRRYDKQTNEAHTSQDRCPALSLCFPIINLVMIYKHTTTRDVGERVGLLAVLDGDLDVDSRLERSGSDLLHDLLAGLHVEQTLGMQRGQTTQQHTVRK